MLEDIISYRAQVLYTDPLCPHENVSPSLSDPTRYTLPIGTQINRSREQNAQSESEAPSTSTQELCGLQQVT